MSDDAILARWPGTCSLCDEPIRPELEREMIVDVPGHGWAHEACAERKRTEDGRSEAA